MDGNIRSTTTVLAAAALAFAGPLQAQDKPVVTATPTSPTTVDVGWTAAAGANEYRVQRGPGAGGPWSAVGPPTAQLAYADATAQPATSYAYRVRAKLPAGQNVTSDPVAVTTPPAGAPSPPAGGREELARAGSGAGMPAAAVGPALPSAVQAPLTVLPNLTCEIQFGPTGIKFIVKNTGGAPASNFKVQWKVDIKDDPPSLPPYFSYPLLPAGGQYELTWPYPSFSAWISVDNPNFSWAGGGDPVQEANETDNSCVVESFP